MTQSGAAEADPFAGLREMFAGRRALLLEDDPALAEHVADRLLKAGFTTVDRVEAGEQALSLAEGGGYDVLILDRLTAGLDGLETLNRIRWGGGPSAGRPSRSTWWSGPRRRWRSCPWCCGALPWSGS